MFTATFFEENQRNFVKSNMGVDLRLVECHKLYPNELYSNYTKDQLHYVIEAVQKGRKPHTQIGLKRLMKRNAAKELKKKIQNKQIPSLNPKSPQQICMKAIRTQFRYKISKTHIQAQPQQKPQSQTLTKRKQNQRKRRIQLIKLTRKYRYELVPHFGDRLNGRGRCPKVSRKEIKDYLSTLGIEANTEWEVFVDQEEMIEEEKNVPLFRDEDFPSLLV